MLGRYVARVFILYWFGLLFGSLFIFFFIKLISPEGGEIAFPSGGWKFAIYLLPYYLSFFFPVVTFIASILTLGRLSTQNELTGAFSIGMRTRNILNWTWLVVIFITISAYTFSLYLGPAGWKKVEEALGNLIADIKNLPLRSFISTRNIAVYRESPDTIFINIKGANYSITILGESPEAIKDGLLLKNGNGVFVSRKNRYGFSFETLEIPSDVLKLERGDNKRAMSIRELVQFSRNLKKYNLNPNPPLAEISERFFYPLSTLLFFIISIPVGLRISSRSFAFSITFSLIFYLIFFSIYSGLKILSGRGIINPYAGPAIYIILLSSFAAILYASMKKRMFRFE